MDIAFRVRNVEVSDNLRRSTLDKVTRLARWCGVDRADVCFSAERNPRIAEREVCAITLFGPGRVLRAQAAATEVGVAADRVVGQLQHRAERFRGRVLGHRRLRGWTATVPPTADGEWSVHFRARWSAAGIDSGAFDHVLCDAGEAEVGSNDPCHGPLTPEEAALEMGERGNDILFFVNAETGWPAVVYRRRDGDVAVFDSVRAPAPRAARGYRGCEAVT